eukprot:1156263-Pelagomonas_calceolata.AAC.10
MFLAGCHNALVVILCVASAYGIGNEAIAQAAGNEQQHHSPARYRQERGIQVLPCKSIIGTNQLVMVEFAPPPRSLPLPLWERGRRGPLPSLESLEKEDLRGPIPLGSFLKAGGGEAHQRPT